MSISVDKLQIEVEAQAQKANDSIDKLVDKLGSLNNALGRMNYSSITGLGNAIQKLGLGMQSLKGVGDKKFENLANSINKLGAVDASKLNSAASAVRTFSRSMESIGELSRGAQQLGELAKGIAQLGYKSSTKAIENIPQLATAMKDLMSTLSTAPRVSQNLIDMTNALGRLARTGASSGRAAASLSSTFNSISTSSIRATGGINKLNLSLGGLWRSLLPFVGIRQLFRWGKEAVELSSSLTEVQNVVDVAFGDMKHKVEELAQTSIEQFGLSELSLKQYASRFQAMGNAMGISESLIGSANQYLNKQTSGYIALSDSMADVSLNLTKLTADMASFYNVEQSAVAEDLAAIFTGQTVPLRQYGLDLTHATLQEWLMKQGIDAKVQSMSQAEKTMLRYQYVLANTGAAQGDFARTANTWANQIRILKQNFQQLGSIIGGTFINALKPLVQALNNVMGKLIQFAKTVSDSLGKIFGWKYEDTTGGFVNDFADVADSTGDIDDSLGGAAKKAKKIRSYLLGIDELNVIEPDSDDGESSGSGLKLGDLGTGGTGNGGGGWKKADGILKGYESKLDTLYKLGEYIGKAITDALNSIDWEKVYEGARRFGRGLADFLNGLISPELFGAVGRTIAGSLNAAIYSALSFAETFDWTGFGLSIATGINEFFKMFDFKSLATAINTWAHGVLDTIIIALDKTDWGTIGTKIGDFLLELDFLGVAKKIGKAIWKAINSGFEIFEGMFETAPLESALLSLVGVTKLLKVKPIKKFIDNLKKGITTALNFTNALMGSQAALSNLQRTIPAISSSASGLGRIFNAFVQNISHGGNLFSGLTASVTALSRMLTPLSKGLIGVGAAFGEFMLVKDAVKDIATGAGNLAANITQIGVAVGAAGAAFSLVFGFPAGLIATGVVAAAGAIAGLNSAFDKIDAEKLGISIKNAFMVPGGVPLDTIVDGARNSIASVGESFTFLSEQSAGLSAANGNIKNTWLEIEKIETAMEAGVLSVAEGTEQLTAQFDILAQAANEKFSAMENSILAAYGENGVLSGALNRLGKSAGNIVGETLGLTDAMSQRLTEITAEMATLDPSNPRYAELRRELSEITLETDGLTMAMQAGAAKINSIQIDFSKLVPTDDGTLDTGYFEAIMGSMVQTVSDTNASIDTAAEDLRVTLQDGLNKALQMGDGEAAAEFKAQLDTLPDAIALLKNDIDTESLGVSDALQTHLIGNIDTIISNAEARWAEMTWAERLYTGFDSSAAYAQNAVEQYKIGYIDPLSASIEEQYAQLGIDGAGWASDATQTIMDSLFNTDVVSDGGFSAFATTLNGNYKQIIERATSGISELAETRGGEVIEGFNSGISNSTESSVVPLTSWQSLVDSTIHDAAMTFGSPSKRAWEYGKWTIDGYNDGILENMEASQAVISQWMESINTAFANTGESSMFSGIAESLKATWNEVAIWWKAEIQRWSSDDVKSWFAKEKWRLIYDPVKSVLKITWEETATWWKSAINRWYNNDVKTWFAKAKWKTMYSTIKSALQEVWGETTAWWKTAIDSWYTNDVKIWFSKEKWTFTGIKEGLTSSFEDAIKECTKMLEDFAKSAEKELSSIGVSTSRVVNAKLIYSDSLQTYRQSSLTRPEDVFVSYAPDYSPVINVSASTEASSYNDMSGIKEAVYDSGAEQAQLLNTAVELLRIIANKDFDMQLDGRSIVEQTRAREKRNGYQLSR